MLSYVTLSTSSFQFSPSEVFTNATPTADRIFKPFSVTVSIPSADMPRDGIARSFVYKVYSVWTVDAGRVVYDNGYALNATVTAAGPPPAGPPEAIISAPSMPVYTYTVGNVPATLPLAFHAVAAAGRTIEVVTATINGNPVTIPTINTLGQVTGLGTGTAIVTVPMPISGANSYTVVVFAQDDMQHAASATKTFTVVVSGPPPTVQIKAPTNNSDFTYFVGPGGAVPSAFNAATLTEPRYDLTGT